MNKGLWILLILIVIIGGLLLWTNKSDAPVIDDSSTAVTPAPAESVAVGEPNPSTPSVKEFAVTGDNFSFSPKEIKVKSGDTVRIVFTNAEGFHDLVLDEFKVATKQLKAGESETVEFVAGKTGTFEYYCSVGSHRANGMVGKLIVE